MFMFVGLLLVLVIVMNKLVVIMGMFMSVMYFIWLGKVDFKIVGKLILLIIVGVVVGVLVVKFILLDILCLLVFVMLVFIVIYIIVKKNWGSVFIYKKMM